jgi:hypothetical protein
MPEFLEQTPAEPMCDRTTPARRFGRFRRRDGGDIYPASPQLLSANTPPG